MTNPAAKPLQLLGHDVIDRDHRAFADLVSTIQASDNVAFPTLFRELIAHTREHFEREDALMVQYACPSLREHRSEHERVLGELQQFLARVDRGFVSFGRAFVLERLVPWFELHILSMDSALVVHLRSLPTALQVTAK
jgi:hemerythrin-like metal-binding protein